MKNKLKALIICTVCAFGAVGVATMSTMPNRFLLSNDSRASTYTLTLDGKNQYKSLPSTADDGTYNIGSATFTYSQAMSTSSSNHIKLKSGGYLLKDEAKNLISINATFSSATDGLTPYIYCRTGYDLDHLDYCVSLTSRTTTNIFGDYIKLEAYCVNADGEAENIVIKKIVYTYSCIEYSSKLNDSYIITEKGKTFSLIKNYNPSSPKWTNSDDNVLTLNQNVATFEGKSFGMSNITLEDNDESSSTVAIVKDTAYPYTGLVEASSSQITDDFDSYKDKFCYKETKYTTLKKINGESDISLDKGLLSFALLGGDNTDSKSFIFRFPNAEYSSYAFKVKFYIYSSVNGTNIYIGGETDDPAETVTLKLGLNTCTHTFAKGVKIHKLKIGQAGQYKVMWEMTKVSSFE